MIGKLKGIVDEIALDYVLVDVQGVGYVVYCSDRTLSDTVKVVEPCTLFIETYVREDQLKLFGFATAFERDWFLLLQVVQGIGAKLALALLSKFTPAQLANAIALQDKVVLSKTPGVGPKAAERIVLELKNKLPKNLSDGASVGTLQSIGTAEATSPVAEAVSALTNLGYSRDQAANAISIAIKETGSDSDSVKLIRIGLRVLSKG
jgi:Holliday junction DNA helicase RuvA